VGKLSHIYELPAIFFMDISNNIPEVNHCEYIYHNGKRCKVEVYCDNSYCHEHSKNIDLDIEFYKQILEHFRQDIREFFVRSNFYFAGQTALFFIVYSKGKAKTNSDFVLLIGGIIFGIIIAFVWYLVSRGAVLWLNRWRQEAIRIDKMISRFKSYATIETDMRKSILHSPSRITRWLPLIFIFFWLLLLVYYVLLYNKIIH
jgi:hypothetical protein